MHHLITNYEKYKIATYKKRNKTFEVGDHVIPYLWMERFLIRLYQVRNYNKLKPNKWIIASIRKDQWQCKPYWAPTKYVYFFNLQC